MERESLTGLLIVLLGGAALQLCASLPSQRAAAAGPLQLERRCWAQVWQPVLPALIVAAWLCGWALGEPDPVQDRLGRWVLCLTCAPFALLLARALVRAVWSLRCEPRDCGVLTVGFIRPQIIFSPYLARLLDERAVDAALEHERAHVRHRDPLRVWLVQFITDLQWPWPAARERFRAWLAALESARDAEARARGIEGADLAAAVVASARFCGGHTPGMDPFAAHLIGGSPAALEERVRALLRTSPEQCEGRAGRNGGFRRSAALLVLILLFAVALGILFGQDIIRPFLAVTS